MINLAPVDFIVIGVYLVLMLWAGFAFSKFSNSADDFIVSGCKANWYLAGASSFMCLFSAWTFTGGASIAYEAGWTFIVIQLINAGFYLVHALFLAAWFRQTRAASVPEIIRGRFDETTRQSYACISMVMGIMGSAITLYGLATFTTAVTGVGIVWVTVVLGGVVVAYSFASGSWAVISTDFLQAILLLPVTIWLAGLSLYEIGGWTAFNLRIEELGLSNYFRIINVGEFQDRIIDFTWLWVIGMFFSKASELMSMNASRRYLFVKDGREAAKGALLAAILLGGSAAIWAIPPMVSRLLFHEDVLASGLNNPAEAAYAVIAMKLLPPGMIGMIMVAMFAATMSTMDTGLNNNAAIFVNDMYPAICRKLGWEPSTGKRLLNIAKLFTLLVGALIILMAINFSRLSNMSLFRLMLELSAIFGSVIDVPLALSLFIRRTPRWSALAAIAVGGCASALGLLAGSELFAGIPLLESPWKIHWRILFNVGVTSLAFAATIPFFRKTGAAYREQLKEFFTRMHTPVDFEKEIGGAIDISQMKIIGAFSLLSGTMVMGLQLVPNLNMIDRLGILFVSIFIIAIGAGLYLAGHRSWKRLKEKQKSE